MAKTIAATGVRGEIARSIQQRLTDLGFDPHGVDGKFFGNTVAAVKKFQQSKGLATSGSVDIATWAALLGTPIPDVRERSLQVTASFEGHGFSLAQGNFDGAGITWGIIGFTLKHGELGKIVLEIQDTRPNLVRDAFGDKTNKILSILKAPKDQQLAFADSISQGSNKTRLADNWGWAFERFGMIPEVQAVQLQRVDQDYFQPARKTARALGLKTELGLALAFDIHVQNGGVSSDAHEQIDHDIAEHPISREQDLRVILANAVADHAKNVAYREDVRSRKLTLATGSGRVHGAFYLLENWGLDDSNIGEL
jgi:Putative peptidoglycan binding domain/Glycosyl hydrolase family 46